MPAHGSLGGPQPCTWARSGPACPRIDPGSACSTAVTRPACRRGPGSPSFDQNSTSAPGPVTPARPGVRPTPDDAGQPSARGVPHVKSTVEHLNPTRVKLTVEVPFDELKPQLRQGLQGARRPGPHPRLPPRQGAGQDPGRPAGPRHHPHRGGQRGGAARSTARPSTEANLSVLGQPDIEVTRIDDGDALAFTAEVDVRPEITLPVARRHRRHRRRCRGHRGRHRRAGRGAARPVRHHHHGRAGRRRRRPGHHRPDRRRSTARRWTTPPPRA